MNSREGSSVQVRSLGELPQAITPPRDLWPAIESQLSPRRRTWAVPASLAAGLVLVTLGVLIGLQVRGPATQQVAPQVAQQSVSGRQIRAALMSDPGYQSHRDEMLSSLPSKLAKLPPASRQRVKDSLQAVQTAMRTIEAELGRDAGNALLQECSSTPARRNACIDRCWQCQQHQPGDLIMSRKWMLPVAALLSTAALAAHAAEVNKQVPVGPNDRVKISNISGSVTITAWDRREVDIRESWTTMSNAWTCGRKPAVSKSA